MTGERSWGSGPPDGPVLADLRRLLAEEHADPEAVEEARRRREAALLDFGVSESAVASWLYAKCHHHTRGEVAGLLAEPALEVRRVLHVSHNSGRAVCDVSDMELLAGNRKGGHSREPSFPADSVVYRRARTGVQTCRHRQSR
ncbi:hypothetical protein F8568_034860 [Actinomadura sp. LD22]|uniref:Uncharacterized protein n=1 Tax=Actinomadura physcomitrii TaxID=2650748 RepID=A0A6I4MH15_9ACTN|nr:hypothetical protein [Actinomadura physcomitrii]MWA05458.1 hypothetical protein [Actinomadura physcomitrii]